MTVKFFIQSKKNPAPIYVRIRGANNTDAKARTKWSIDPKEWSKVKGQPKDLKNEDYKALNNDLNNFSKDLANEINKLPINQKIDSLWLKNYILPISDDTTNKIPTDLINYIDYYIKCKANEVSVNSIKKFNVVKNKLQRFVDKRGSRIQIEDVNEKFKSEFIEYCQSQNYSVNTIQRELVFIKTFCKHARHNGLDTNHQLDSLKAPKEKSEKIYLTIDELNKIEKTNIKSKALKNARDWLIISCYTGQRVSDFLNFNKSQLRIEKDVTLIEFTQKKTGKIIGLPLHPKVLAILKKNQGEFPYKIADQKYNEHLKDLCKECGIGQLIKGSKKAETKKGSKIYRKETGMFPKHELVTSHIGRRSFATNFYGSIPTPLLMSATGHSTEKMFLEYIGKSSTDQALELANYFNKIQ